MTTSPKRQFGDLGEKIACRYLRGKGYQILDINFQNKLGLKIGEIDIIAKDLKHNEIAFVEVKTRNLGKYSETLPEENVTYPKMLRLSKIADAYLRLKQLDDFAFRFDAISVWLDLDSKKARVKHIDHI
jgi:putative endonuclease